MTIIKEIRDDKNITLKQRKNRYPIWNRAVNVMGKLAAVLPLNIKRKNKKCIKNCKSNILPSCY